MVKNSSASAGDIRDVGSISELGRTLGEGNGNPLQYSCLDNPMERGAWQSTNFTGFCLRASLVAQTVKNLPAMQEIQVQSLGWEDPLQKAMAIHSSILLA